MIIKINNCFYDKDKISLELFLKLFPNKKENDFYAFKGIEKPTKEIINKEKNELSTLRSKRNKKTNIEISKDDKR